MSITYFHKRKAAHSLNIGTTGMVGRFLASGKKLSFPLIKQAPCSHDTCAVGCRFLADFWGDFTPNQHAEGSNLDPHLGEFDETNNLGLPAPLKRPGQLRPPISGPKLQSHTIPQYPQA